MYSDYFALCSKEGREERMEGEAWDEDLSPTYFEEGEEPEFERAELDSLERVVGDGRAKAIRLSYSLLKHITNGFSEENVIGRGAFAKVYVVCTIKLLSRLNNTV
jgi:hypothetical protein